MKKQHSIEARTQEKWPPHFIQELEDVFQDAVEFFRQVGLSQEQIDAFWELNNLFRLIKGKGHYYRMPQGGVMRH